jgi:alpha-amylase
MRFRLIPVVLLMLALHVSCSYSLPKPTASSSAPMDTEISTTPTLSTAWWKSAVFYEIFIRSFNDSNGDGVGDINGLIQKLDYLNDGNPTTDSDLGINAIWLMPIHPSPSYHGYDVLNYYAINPEYGTMDDFKRLLVEAHKRGIKVIIDLVLNHTSSQHPFFIDAKSSENSEYRDWYIWSATDDSKYWHEANVGPNSKYYYGYFCDCMPDLNYRNPDVTQQMEKVVNFWISNVGVDGFRIDAAKHIIEDGNKVENTPQTHDWFKQFYTFYKGINPNIYTVGEVASSDARMTTLYSDREMDMIFNFELAQGFVNSAKGESNSGVGSAVSFIQQDAPDGNFATFLTNHDQNRVMSVVNGNVEKAKVAAALLLTSSGTPFIYYGEEIGMMGTKPDEDIRRPMQWNAERNAGFTIGTPWRLPDNNFKVVNVASEELDQNSLLNTYKALIQLRQSNPALSAGDYIEVNSSDKAIYAALRQYDNKTLMVVINLSKNEVNDAYLSWDASKMKMGNYNLTSLYGETKASPLTISNSTVDRYLPNASIPAYSINIYELQVN